MSTLTFPPAGPITSGDELTLSRFMNDPTSVSRRVNEIARQNMVSTMILTESRNDVSGGAIQFTEDDEVVSEVMDELAPGTTYPQVSVSGGTQRVLKMSKWGQRSPVTDESLKRRKSNAIERVMRGIANSAILSTEQLNIDLIQSSVTRTVAATDSWSAAGANLIKDLTRLSTAFNTRTDPFRPDTVLVDPESWVELASHKQILEAQSREGRENVLYTGEFKKFGNLSIITSPYLNGRFVAAFDTTMFGGIATENLGGDYVGDPIQVKTYRSDDSDSWQVQARRTSVPYVQSPLAAVKLTGF